MISREKIALIHVAKKDLELSDEAYRHVLRDHGGVESARDLDDAGADRVIKCFQALGFWVKRKWSRERPRDAGELPTPDQLKVIEHLWKHLAEYVGGAQSRSFQRGFMERRLGLPGLGPQTRAQANKLIEALKKRVLQEMKKHGDSNRDQAAI